MEKPKLYVKNEKGRYEPYREPMPPHNNCLYRKIMFGNKVCYIPDSMSLTQELQEGVWVVIKQTYGKSYTTGKYLRDMFRCEKACDIQETPLSKLGGMEKLADYLCAHFDDIPNNLSRHDICRTIVGILFQYEKEKNNGE